MDSDPLPQRRQNGQRSPTNSCHLEDPDLGHHAKADHVRDELRRSMSSDGERIIVNCGTK